MENQNSADNGATICPICSKPNQGQVNVICKQCKIQIHYHCSGVSRAKVHSSNYVCFECKTSKNSVSQSKQASACNTSHQITPTTTVSQLNQQATALNLSTHNGTHGSNSNGQQVDLPPAAPQITGPKSPNRSVASDINDAIRNMNNELEKLKHSQQIVVDSLSSVSVQLTSISSMTQVLEEHGKRVEALEIENDKLQRQVDVIDRKMDELDQKNRGDNIQIDGIPEIGNENLRDVMIKLATALNIPLSSNDIVRITRVQSTNANKAKPIICNFTKSNLPLDLIKASRKLKPTTTSTGISNDKGEIFINEHLTVARKQLMYKAKQFKKANGYEFLWIKNGNIYLKKAKNTKAINVNVSTDFSRLN